MKPKLDSLNKETLQTELRQLLGKTSCSDWKNSAIEVVNDIYTLEVRRHNSDGEDNINFMIQMYNNGLGRSVNLLPIYPLLEQVSKMGGKRYYRSSPQSNGGRVFTDVPIYNSNETYQMFLPDRAICAPLYCGGVTVDSDQTDDVLQAKYNGMSICSHITIGNDTFVRNLTVEAHAGTSCYVHVYTKIDDEVARVSQYVKKPADSNCTWARFEFSLDMTITSEVTALIWTGKKKRF